MKTRLRTTSTLVVPAFILMSSPALAQAADPDWNVRLKRLEEANARLQAEVQALREQAAAQAAAPIPVPSPQAAPAAASAPDDLTLAAAPVAASAPVPRQTIGLSPTYSRAILEHTEGVNDRTLIQLRARRDGQLDNTVTVSGRVVVIGDFHHSNRANKFGYLMRHPTGNNQRTFDTQEITVNSAQLAFTFNPHPDFTGYVEMLYDPEQSFGAGTLTALTRNQVQVRKAYMLWGNLAKRPIYAAAGKLDVPFGLQDSVSPFSNSSVWHAFAPLAYGGLLGYYDGRLSLRGMAVVGGAQFRSANMPVDGTAVPSKLNNFAIDGSYTVRISPDTSFMAGASYLRGSAYCQPYPVQHFGACSVAVPAWSVYGRLDAGRLRLIGELSRTTRIWPGTRVPDPNNPLSLFPASRVSAFTVGARYRPKLVDGLRVSAEYSKFIPGAVGSPWHRQDQLTLGLAQQLGETIELFGEYVRVKGFVPLNFLSGGNFPDGSTWSDQDAKSRVVVVGVKAGF